MTSAVTSAKESPALNLSARIPELDGLRGLAILLVILCHYVGNPDHTPLGFFPHRFLLAFTVGWSGVDLFFVLSGFLIGGILLDARNSPQYFRAFYMRRVFRILPIYYLWTLLFAATVIAALVFFPGRLGVAFSDLLRVPVQLLFLQNIFIGMPHFTWTWFVVTWSLAIEEQFYLLAPPLIRFLSLRRFVITLAATIVLAPVLRFMLFRYWAPGTYLCAFLMPCRADSLSCGMLLAVAWRDARFREFIRIHVERCGRRQNSPRARTGYGGSACDAGGGETLINCTRRMSVRPLGRRSITSNMRGRQRFTTCGGTRCALRRASSQTTSTPT